MTLYIQKQYYLTECKQKQKAGTNALNISFSRHYLASSA